MDHACDLRTDLRLYTDKLIKELKTDRAGLPAIFSTQETWIRQLSQIAVSDGNVSAVISHAASTLMLKHAENTSG